MGSGEVEDYSMFRGSWTIPDNEIIIGTKTLPDKQAFLGRKNPVLLRLICMMLPFHDEGFDLSSVASLPSSLFGFGYSWPTSSSPALLLYLMAHYLLGGISAETFVGTCRGKEVAIKVLSTKKLDDSALDRFKEQCAKLKCVTCCRIPALIETNSFRSIGKS